MSNTISNNDDVIDSRDVIHRIEELEAKEDEWTEAKENLAGITAQYDAAVDGAPDADFDVSSDAVDEAQEALNTIEIDFDEDEREELKVLRELAEEAEGYASDWIYGATLIRESYFEEYCQQLVEDIGDLPKDMPGYLVIDWEATAHNLRQDYTSVDFDGVDYLVR